VLHNPLLVDSAVFDAITLFSLCSSVYAVYPPIQPHTVCRNWYPVVNTYRTTVYTTRDLLSHREGGRGGRLRCISNIDQITCKSTRGSNRLKSVKWVTDVKSPRQ
jgi:hypothetical protein